MDSLDFLDADAELRDVDLCTVLRQQTPTLEHGPHPREFRPLRHLFFRNVKDSESRFGDKRGLEGMCKGRFTGRSKIRWVQHVLQDRNIVGICTHATSLADR